MKLAKNAMAIANSMPKIVWIVAILMPGGLTAIGIWLFLKSFYKSIKSNTILRKKHDKG